MLEQPDDDPPLVLLMALSIFLSLTSVYSSSSYIWNLCCLMVSCFMLKVILLMLSYIAFLIPYTPTGCLLQLSLCGGDLSSCTVCTPGILISVLRQTCLLLTVCTLRLQSFATPIVRVRVLHLNGVFLAMHLNILLRPHLAQHLHRVLHTYLILEIARKKTLKFRFGRQT